MLNFRHTKFGITGLRILTLCMMLWAISPGAFAQATQNKQVAPSDAQKAKIKPQNPQKKDGIATAYYPSDSRGNSLGPAPLGKNFSRNISSRTSIINPTSRAFIYDGPGPFQLEKHALSNPSALTAVGATVPFGYPGAMALNPTSQKMYVVDQAAPFGLYTIDTVTGNRLLVKNLTGVPQANLTGIAYDPIGGVMYGLSSSIAVSQIFTINITTGVCTPLGTPSALVAGGIQLNAAPGGSLFTVDIVTDALYRWNKTTGIPTLIGPLGVDANYGQDGHFDLSDGQYYWAAYTTGPELRVIDTLTGSSTVIGAYADQASTLGIYSQSTVACSGTPAPGNTITSDTAVCPSQTFTLSLQNITAGSGVTYQWQSAPSATGPWANVGPNSPVYTLTASGSPVLTFYRSVVTCGGNSGTSTPVKVNANPPGNCYCTPNVTNCNLDDQIQQVIFGGIDNSSTCSTNGYGNYTALTAGVAIAGGGNAIQVQVGPGGTEYVVAWIDYNKNGIFEASEYTAIGSGNGTLVSGSINIPSNAQTGLTRMRIRVRFGTNPAPGEACTTPGSFGEVEDYTVNITPCVPITYTTQPADKTVSCGANTFFSVKTAGSLPAYQWQYRTTATGTWLNVPATAPYSGVNKDTLFITGATADLTGYQYRVSTTGPCAAANPSNAATLTVTPLVAVVTPASATICAGSSQRLTLTNTLNPLALINEGFNVVVPLPAGWAQKNNGTPAGSNPIWFQGNPTVFPSHSGAPEAYIAANFNSVTGDNTISNWLFSPQINVKNGDVLTFWTRVGTAAAFADRMQVRMSSNGASVNVGNTNTSVGDFTTLLVDINPDLLTTGPTKYPDVWTKYTVTISGLTGTVSSKFAFRHFVTSGGPAGDNSSYLGLDDVTYTASGSSAQGLWTTTAAGTIFNDSLATSPYVTGTPATVVFVKPTVTSTYTVSFTSGACASNPTNVVVKVNAPATAVAAVANQSTCPGGTVKFISSVTGGSGVVKVWQVSTDGGVTYINVTASAVYSGVATDTLTVKGATASLNNYKYRLSTSASPCAGTPLVSTAGTLTVFPAPTVVLSAAPYTSLYPGLSTTLTVTVTPTTGATYMWYKNGVLIPGVTGNKYPGLTVDDFGTYNVKITDGNGCAGTSNSITLKDSANSRFFVYPSPNNGQFSVRYYNDNPNAARALVVYDSKGSRVFYKKYTMTGAYVNMQVDLSLRGKGVYHVELIDSKGNRLKTASVVVL